MLNVLVAEVKLNPPRILAGVRQTAKNRRENELESVAKRRWTHAGEQGSGTHPTRRFAVARIKIPTSHEIRQTASPIHRILTTHTSSAKSGEESPCLLHLNFEGWTSFHLGLD